MGLYNRVIRKFVQQFTALQEEVAGRGLQDIVPPPSMEPVDQSLEHELVR